MAPFTIAVLVTCQLRRAVELVAPPARPRPLAVTVSSRPWTYCVGRIRWRDRATRVEISVRLHRWHPALWWLLAGVLLEHDDDPDGTGEVALEMAR